MKYILYLLFFIALPVYSIGQNLIKPLDSWRIDRAENIHVDTGANEKIIVIENLDEENSAIYTYPIPVQVDSAKKYTFSFDERGFINAESYADLWLNIYQGKQILYTKIIPHVDTTNWNHRITSFVLPPEADRVRLGMRLTGKGKIDLRSLSLVKDEDVVFKNDRENLIFDRILDTLSRHSLYNETLQSSDLKKNAKQIATEDLEDAVNYLFSKLGDRHARIDVNKATVHDSQSEEQPVASLKEIGEQGISYVKIPSLNHYSPEFYDHYARSLYNAVANIKNKRLLLDLRGNSGGVVWPMISGLAPLLPDGDQAYFSYVDGSQKAIKLLHGKAFSNAASFHQISDVVLRKNHKPQEIVVLIDRKTASSAEMLAVIMTNYDKFKIVGKPSAGYMTGVSTYTFGSAITLRASTSVFLNKNRKPYTDNIEPIVLPALLQKGLETLDESAINQVFDYLF